MRMTWPIVSHISRCMLFLYPVSGAKSLSTDLCFSPNSSPCQGNLSSVAQPRLGRAAAAPSGAGWQVLYSVTTASLIRQEQE